MLPDRGETTTTGYDMFSSLLATHSPGRIRLPKRGRSHVPLGDCRQRRSSLTPGRLRWALDNYVVKMANFVVGADAVGNVSESSLFLLCYHWRAAFLHDAVNDGAWPHLLAIA